MQVLLFKSQIYSQTTFHFFKKTKHFTLGEKTLNGPSCILLCPYKNSFAGGHSHATSHCEIHSVKCQWKVHTTVLTTILFTWPLCHSVWKWLFLRSQIPFLHWQSCHCEFRARCSLSGLFSCSSEVLSSVQGYTNMQVYVSLWLWNKQIFRSFIF